ncbi:hypothetical protein R1flu_004654 [Riccia fluitans]|uniref:Uncharacterized protein n=1 Tax=Riccia fluitans TaxID=41844 RepID=A0ABD1YRR9_9MARC
MSCATSELDGMQTAYAAFDAHSSFQFHARKIAIFALTSQNEVASFDGGAVGLILPPGTLSSGSTVVRFEQRQNNLRNCPLSEIIFLGRHHLRIREKRSRTSNIRVKATLPWIKSR